MAKSEKTAPAPQRFGLGEWYGLIVDGLAPAELNRLAAKAKESPKNANVPCPFRQASSPGAICNKKGGVCSIQLHQRNPDGSVVGAGPFVTMCPNRFWQDNKIFTWVGQTILGTAHPILVKEVGFLESLSASMPAHAAETDVDDGDDQEESPVESNEDVKESVGRIDTIVLHPDDSQKWCALELQAVYFSGKGMPSHLDQYADEAIKGLAFPDEVRRPDFRSSGPKRLMPQLQTKVPTLRRWGKKMVVVVDDPFFESLGPITPIPYLSNADIAWFVVSYDLKTGAVELKKTVYSTLENSVEALTAGIPRSVDAFEAKLKVILESNKKASKKKIIRL